MRNGSSLLGAAEQDSTALQHVDRDLSGMTVSEDKLDAGRFKSITFSFAARQISILHGLRFLGLPDRPKLQSPGNPDPEMKS